MIGFYAIRKLIEANKVSLSLRKGTLDALAWPHIGTPVDQMNWHKIDQLYDLGQPKTVDLRLRFIADQIIHSFVFVPIFSEQGCPIGIAFSSERK